MSNPTQNVDLQEHYRWAKHLAYGLVRDTEVAGDLAQETWLAVLKNPPASGVHPRAWWAGILRKKALRYWRSKRRREDHEQRAAQSVQARGELQLTPEELLASSETTRSLLEELEQLPEPFRGTLLAAAHSGMSSAEIARQGGLPEGTVRWRMKRGRELLAERLDQRFGGRESWMRALIPLLAAGPEWLAGLSASALVAASALFALLAGTGYLALDQGGLEAGEQGAGLVPETRSVTVPGASEAGLAVTGLHGQGRSPVADQALLEGRNANRLWSLSPGQAGVQLRLVDPTGEPVRGVLFELPGARGTFSMTDETGTADLRFWPVSNSVSVDLFLGSAGKQRVGAIARQLLSVNVRGGEWVELGEVVGFPLVAFTGQVLDGNGNGLPGASLFVSNPLAGSGNSYSLLEGPPVWEPYASHATLTHEDGSFELLAPNRPLHLWAGKRGHFYAVQTRALHSQACQFQLRELPQSQWIRGRVSSPDGAPVARVEVRSEGVVLEDSGSSQRKSPHSLAWRSGATEAVTDTRGEFLIPVHSNDPQRVRLWDADDLWEELELELLPGQEWRNLRFLNELR